MSKGILLLQKFRIMKIKSLFILLLFSATIFAQENNLLNQSWFLVNTQIDGVNYEKPNLHDAFSNTFFSATKMFTTICETGGIIGDLSIDTVNSEINFTNITLYNGDCLGSESIQFRNSFYSFFDDISNPFHYFITSDENGLKILTLENNGNLLTFNSYLNFSPEIISQNTWYLTDLVIDGVSHPPFVSEEFQYISLKFEENNGFLTTVCSSLMGLSDFFNEDKFFIQDVSQTMISCGISENEEYEQLYLNFFWNNYFNPYEYTVLNENDDPVLVITDINGNQAIYSNHFMSVNENRKTEFSIFPNPVKNTLFIKTEHSKNTILKVLDISGKITVSQPLSEKSSVIDLSHLPKGIYFVTIEENGKILKSEKIIKK